MEPTSHSEGAKQYETPEITDHGNLADLTAGLVSPKKYLDATFPAGTPYSDLRFTAVK